MRDRPERQGQGQRQQDRDSETETGRQSKTVVVVSHRDSEKSEAGGHSAAGAAPEARLQGRSRGKMIPG